ncbi:unnamed protein product [Auanema sp. JU1783]|nr:unnamed protein product [Auanema sp. JU1783]
MNSMYDHQVPSTSNGSNLLTPPNMMPHPSPFRVANAGPVQKVRDSCGIRNPTYFNQWMTENPAMCGNYRHDGSRPGSTAGSIAGSVATGLSGNMSEMSIGQMSSLTVDTQVTAVAYSYPQPPVMPTSSSSIENYDFSQLYSEIDQNVDHVLRAFSMRNSIYRRKATNSVMDMANRKYLTYVQPKKMKRLLSAMFDVIVDKDAEPETVAHLLKIICLIHAEPMIEELMTEQKGRPLLAAWSRIHANMPYTQNALTAVWLMLCHKNTRRRRYVRSKESINQLMQIALIDDMNYTVKALAIGSTRLLLSKYPIMKEHFNQHIGMYRILPFLDMGMDEKVIAETAKLCLSLICSSSKEYAMSFLNYGGVERTTNLLSHGSPRVLTDCLHCLSAVSDLPEMRMLDLAPTILAVIRLFGSEDPRTAQYGTAFILNVSALSSSHKKFITEARGPALIMSVLSMVREYIKYPLPTIRQIVDSILVNAFGCLANLTLGGPGDEEWLIQARQQVSQHDPRFLLNTLANRNVVELRAKILLILERVFTSVPEYMKLFIDLRDDCHQQTLSTIVMQLVFDLLNRYPQFMNASPNEKKQINDLVRRGMKLLCVLASYPDIAQAIGSTLQQERLNPLQYLRIIRDFNDEVTNLLRCCMLRFIDELTSADDRKRLLFNWLHDDVECAKIVHHATAVHGTEIRKYAVNLLNRYESFFNPMEPIPNNLNYAQAMHPEYL